MHIFSDSLFSIISSFGPLTLDFLKSIIIILYYYQTAHFWIVSFFF